MAYPADEAGKQIIIEDVSFSYSETKVLDKISFVITKGDFLAILGPNGSGKTTLIKTILGLLKPQSGRIFILGKTVMEFDAWHRIGYVPQKAIHFDPYFPVSVREVVAMGFPKKKHPLWISRSQKEERIRNVLDLVDMKKFLNRRIGRLSSGQQQRVFIARAIVNHPDILFLDEPTTGVDAGMQDQFYDMLDELNEKKGITIVLVTHETGIINKHVTQVACLNQKLVYHGAHAEFCRSQEFKKMLDDGHHLIDHRH